MLKKEKMGNNKSFNPVNPVEQKQIYLTLAVLMGLSYLIENKACEQAQCV